MMDVSFDVAALCLSPDGGHILVGGEARLGGGFIQVWDAATFEEVHSMQCKQAVTSVAVSDEYDVIIAACARGLVCVWEGPGAFSLK